VLFTRTGQSGVRGQHDRKTIKAIYFNKLPYFSLAETKPPPAENRKISNIRPHLGQAPVEMFSNVFFRILHINQ